MQNKKIKLTFLFLIFLFFGLLSLTKNSKAATYYVDASQINDSGNGQTTGTAKKYIESGIALMSSGDTLIINDGTYSTTNDQIVNMPNGTVGAYTTIKAANDGGAIITATDGFSFNANYVQIEGLKFSGTWQKTTDGNHIKILRCAFQGGPTSGNNINFAVGTSYVLIEDCWFYGQGGRYKILIYQADHIILRRCVIRQDAGWTVYESDPEAGVAVYESSNVSLQNVIVIDSTLNYTANYVGSFYQTGHGGNPSSNNVEYLGCISLNNKGQGFHNDTDDGGIGCNLTDFIVYANESGLNTSNTSTDMIMRRLTVGNLDDRGIQNWGANDITVYDSNFFNLIDATTRNSVTITYSNSYNPADLSGTGITNLNPITNGLLYLPRIENASTLKTGGQSNGQKGAQITKKMGTSGTLHGETGYNILTSEDLWPWPNEDRIKTDFASVSGGLRGFATSGNGLYGGLKTLTSYIWEYLGNSCPTEICNYGLGDITAPIAPSGLAVQ
jgi:hypothetical protein